MSNRVHTPAWAAVLGTLILHSVAGADWAVARAVRVSVSSAGGGGDGSGGGRL